MSNLFVWKEQLQKLYANQSRYIDKIIRFILGLLVFGLINGNIGFMKAVSQPIATVVFAVIFTFVPLSLMAVVAAAMILLHFYTLSMPLALVVGAVFLLMFIFYFRFTPKSALILLLTPVAFVLKVPYIIPIAYGLIGSPIYVVPIACGTMTYYILSYVKASVTTIKSSDANGLIGKVTVFSKQIFQNKEMLVVIAAFTICLLLVYNVRKMSMDHAWKIAIITGAIANLVVIVAGNMMFDIQTPYVQLILGSVVAIFVGIVLEFFVFSVDYSRTEHLEFEDDEYCYYVKAVPKLSVAVPEKTVKRINERQETSSIDAQAVRSQNRKKRTADIERQAAAVRRAEEQKKTHAQRTSMSHKQANQVLLEKSLKEELRK
ncbi:hypothetical protein ACTQ6A_05690 [Lachnospiraceae bacterium LCP25S3_G4]